MNRSLPGVRAALVELARVEESPPPPPPRRLSGARACSLAVGLGVLGGLLLLGPAAPSARWREEPASLQGGGRALQVVPLGLELPLPGRFQALGALPDGSRAYVAVEGVKAVLVLDTVRLQWLAPLPVSFPPDALCVVADGSTLLAQDAEGHGAGWSVSPEHLPWTPTARCERPLRQAPQHPACRDSAVSLPAYAQPLLSAPD